MMVTVLQQDFGIRYNPERIRNPDFRDAGDLFIHGLLGENGGTCASMPVLYAAVGRRLGWPIKLVHAHTHLFCRWDDLEGQHPYGKERFNIEATGQGANFFADDYYRTWPEPVPDDMIERLGYLKSLSPAEELADFLRLRGHCLEDNGSIGKACEAYRSSCQLAEADILHRAFWEHAEMVRDRLIERQTLLDYFGPDVPLPFGYFPRHVLRQMASDMLKAEVEHDNRKNQLEREQFEAKWQMQMQTARPNAHDATGRVPKLPLPTRQMPPSIPNWQWSAGFDATELPVQRDLVGSIPSVPSPPGWIGYDSTYPSPLGNSAAALPAKLLRTIDPQHLAMRRHQAVEITRSLPKGGRIQQPIRLLLVPPTQPPAIQSTSQQEN
jgi:Transglutaminase-like superfamily